MYILYPIKYLLNTYRIGYLDDTYSMALFWLLGLPKYLHDYNLEVNYCMLSCAKEPKTFSEASKCPEWREAISKELNSHENLGTWSPATLPGGAKAIETRWVFKIKDDGTKKARLVAKGFQLKPDNNEHVYAPVCRPAIL